MANPVIPQNLPGDRRVPLVSRAPDFNISQWYDNLTPTPLPEWAPPRPVNADPPFATPPRTFWLTLLGSDASISGQSLRWFLSNPGAGILRPNVTLTLVSVYATNQSTSVPLEWAIGGLNTNTWSTSDRAHNLRTWLVPDGSLYTPPPPSEATVSLQDLDLFSSGRNLTLTLLTSGNAFSANDTYRLTLKITEHE